MSHASSTAHYNLPIYADVDIINPLTDFNDCNTAIDNKLYEVAQGTASVVNDITDVKNQLGSETLDTTSQTVTGAINELKAGEDALDTRVVTSETDVATLQAQMATATTNISNLGTSVAGLQTEMAGKASATALQTLTTKVGTGNLDTLAQNCVDAINEVLSKIPTGGSVLAEDVVYINTTSGLTATDVQGAIDEIASNGSASLMLHNITYTAQGDGTNDYVRNDNIDATLSGYKLLGVIGTSSNSYSYMPLICHRASDTAISAVFVSRQGNPWATATSVIFTLYCLYEKE